MRRRALLASATTGIVASVAGCIGTFGAPGGDADENPTESTDSWTQFRADATRAGATSASAPETGGHIRWWSDTIGMSTAPVIEDGTVYFGSGLRNQSVFAFDQHTGERDWQAPVGDDIERSLAVRDGTVYVAAESVYALDAETGEEYWREPVDTTRGLAVDGETVYSASAGGGPVLALDTESGEERWRREIHSLTPPAVADHRVFVVGNDNVVAIDAESGDTDWEESINRAGGPPTVVDGTVCIGTRENVFALDAETGQHEWTIEGTFRGADIAANNGMVYVAGRQEEDDEWISRVLAIETESGKVQWTCEDPGLGSGSAVVTDEMVYVATRFRMYAIDRDSGDIAWWLRFEWPVESPAIADGHLFVTVGGRLMAIESGDGRDGVWESDAEPIPDRSARPPEPSYADSDATFEMDGFDVDAEWDVHVEEDAPVEIGFEIDGDRVDEDVVVTITLEVRNTGEEPMGFSTGAPRPFGVFRLTSEDNHIVAWTPAYEESGHVHTSPHGGITGVNSIALGTAIPPGETVSETYTISHDTHGIRSGTYEFTWENSLSPREGEEGDAWEVEVAGTVELFGEEITSGDVVHDLVVADDVDLPAEFPGAFTVDVLKPVTNTHPGLIEVTLENASDERSQMASMRGWPFGSFVGLGPDGRRLVLLPAATFAPGFVERTETSWWEPAVLPHESVSSGRSITSYDPGETSTVQFVVTTHPQTDDPRNGDSYAFEQGFGTEDVDVTWGFALSTIDPGS